LNAALAHLRKTKKIEHNQQTVGLVGYGPKLSKGEKVLLGQLTEDLKAAGLQPPTPKQLQAAAKKNRDSVPQLLQLASDSGQLVKVAPEVFLHAEVVQQAQDKIALGIKENDGLTMSEIRQLLDTSRKYAVPLCEYFDSINFTKREGDKRLLGSA